MNRPGNISLHEIYDKPTAASLDGGAPAGPELAAIACVMMLERVNYLNTAGITIPREQITEQITDIILAAFPPS